MGWFLKVKFRYTFFEIKISIGVGDGVGKKKKERSLWLFWKGVKEKVWNTLALFMITIQRLAVYWTSLYIMYWMLPPERNAGGWCALPLLLIFLSCLSLSSTISLPAPEEPRGRKKEKYKMFWLEGTFNLFFPPLTSQAFLYLYLVFGTFIPLWSISQWSIHLVHRFLEWN